MEERLVKITAVPVIWLLCQDVDERIEHLFYKCEGVNEVCEGVRKWLNLRNKDDWKDWIQYILAHKASSAYKEIMYATFNAVVFTI